MRLSRGSSSRGVLESCLIDHRFQYLAGQSASLTAEWLGTRTCPETTNKLDAGSGTEIRVIAFELDQFLFESHSFEQVHDGGLSSISHFSLSFFFPFFFSLFTHFSFFLLFFLLCFSFFFFFFLFFSFFFFLFLFLVFFLFVLPFCFFLFSSSLFFPSSAIPSCLCNSRLRQSASHNSVFRYIDTRSTTVFFGIFVFVCDVNVWIVRALFCLHILSGSV